jgi:serine O-acetyltransferase
MKNSLSNEELGDLVTRQVNGIIPDPAPIERDQVRKLLPPTLERVQACFRQIEQKYFYVGGQVRFDHLHSDQYAMFLYLLANTAFKISGDENLATKIFLLNKCLHGIDAYFRIELQEVFLFVHPVGTVLGNAKYGNYFAVYQNCGIGADEDGVYPQFGDGVIMYARSSVLGHSTIGNNVVLGANTFVLNTNVPDNSVVTGSFPDLKIRASSRKVLDRRFRGYSYRQSV